MSKTGVAIDLDWIVSLGIFLIYLGVFFISIRQLPSTQTPTSALLDSVADGVSKSATWHVQRLPLVIASNFSGTEPLLVPFSYDWKNFSFTDNTSFDVSEGKLIFIKTLNKGRNLAQLVTSSQNYSAPARVFDLAAGPNGASVNSQKFISEFQNSILTRVNHAGKERLSDLNISISGVTFKPESGTAEATAQSLSAKYKLILPKINHTSFIVAGYSRIFNYVTTDAQEPHSMLVSATIRNYTSYFINNALSGQINYTSQGCTSSKTNYVDFYDENNGLTLIAPSGGNLTFCVGNTSISLGVEFQIAGETRYDLIFHPGTFNSTLKYVDQYKTAFGVSENLSGISLSLYKKLNETNYQTLKDRFGYPKTKEFSFTLLNDSGAAIFDYQPVKPGITDIFTKEVDLFLLNSYGAKVRNKLRVKGW